MKMAVLLALVVVLTLFTGLTKSNCPVHGCTPVCSYTSEVQFASQSGKPRLAWSYGRDSDVSPSGAGCVTNGARIICPVTSSSNRTSYLFSWGTTNADRMPWNVSFKATVVLPTVDYSGDYIASDGLVLEGFGSTGVPFGDPVTLYPVHGQLFDLSIAASKVVLLYKCGFLATYLTSGIPHASIWLNDTLSGNTGTFIPLNNPATDGSNRLYVLTAFRAHAQNAAVSRNLKLRLFAIDLLDSTVLRISIPWYYDFTVVNVSLPYLESAETVCSEQSLKTDQNGMNSLAQVAVSDNFVTILFRYREPKVFANPDLYNHSRMLILEDMGKSFSVRFSGDTENAFQALAFANNISYWTAFYYIRTKQSMLQRHMFPRGEMTGEINIAKLLNVGDHQVNITSDITFLKMDSTSPLLFCVLVNNMDSKLLAVDVSNEKLLWAIDLGTELCTGQISSIDGLSQNSFLVLTTSSQLLVYSLT